MLVHESHENDRAAITISATVAESAAVGYDHRSFCEWTTSALRALVALRTGYIDGDPAKGAPTEDFWYWVINDIEKLKPRLDGILEATIGAHHAAGASIGNLALAMDVPRSTAQDRRKAVVDREPSMWQEWAFTGGPAPKQDEAAVALRDKLLIELRVAGARGIAAPVVDDFLMRHGEGLSQPVLLRHLATWVRTGAIAERDGQVQGHDHSRYYIGS